MPRRLIILGGPRVGKSTLSERIQEQFGVTLLRKSADIEHLGWSESSEFASKWFDDPGEWICEGVQMARALRKWLKANPEKPLDADLILMTVPLVAQLDGQKAMQKGVETVFREIETELLKRGARIHKPKTPDDATRIIEESFNQTRQSAKTTGVRAQVLKIYDKLEDVPEALREHYKLVNGKAVPDLSEDHPVLVNNRTLLNEKNAAETKASGLETQVTTLKADLESAKASNLPRGHKAVTNADAELLEKLKPLGTAEEITTKLTEHKTLKEEGETRKQQDHLRTVAKTLEYDEEAFLLLPKLVAQFPDMEIREQEGKKVVIAKVKDDKGVITEKLATEFISATSEFSKVALKSSTGGTRIPEQRGDLGGGGSGDDLITQRNKQRETARQANPNPLMAKAAQATK